jgi:hypothetical protein
MAEVASNLEQRVTFVDLKRLLDQKVEHSDL